MPLSRLFGQLRDRIARHVSASFPQLRGAQAASSVMGDHKDPELRLSKLNQAAVNAQYAVRGEIVLKAQEYEKALQDGKQLPFNNLVYCNIGNPQAIGQQPITFFRQVLAICDYPALLSQPNIDQIFPADVLRRAKTILDRIPGGTGAYSTSQGADVLRESIVRFIEKRDGHSADKGEIFMTDGASPAVHNLCRVLVRSENDCVLTPMPHYPLYSACISLYDGTLLPYYLDEENNWELNIEELKATVDSARAQGKSVRAMAVINPGNPTGQCLSLQNQKQVCEFCHKEGLVLLADEVYQDNVYAQNKSFTSFKKVVRDLGGDIASTLPLVSMHSISKGFYGECGRRGGYFELTNFPSEVLAQFYKLASVNLCPNVNGQICVSLMVEPPQKGEESYELFNQERTGVLESLKRRSAKLVSALNELENVQCNQAEGALYAFPRVKLPPKAIEAAEKAGKGPDTFYCLCLLEEAGIVVVPGSGFGQKKDTFHFRTTFLPKEEDIDSVVDRLSSFHSSFMQRYR